MRRDARRLQGWNEPQIYTDEHRSFLVVDVVMKQSLRAVTKTQKVLNKQKTSEQSELKKRTAGPPKTEEKIRVHLCLSVVTNKKRPAGPKIK